MIYHSCCVNDDAFISLGRRLQYQPDPSEIVILKHCQEVMLERTLCKYLSCGCPCG